MSDDIRNDEGLLGYYLPKGARACLEKLSGDLAFLKRVASPPTAGEGDAPPSLTGDELASCLALLAMQLDQVLSEASGRASPVAAERFAEAADDDAAPAPDALHTGAEYRIPNERLVFGVTMDQWDALDRLMQTLQAHGDVVSASNMADFAPGTLTMVGHAIFDGAMEVREILDQVEAQTLPEATRSRSGVREGRAVYAAGVAPVAVDGPFGLARRPSWPPQHTGQPGGLRTH